MGRTRARLNELIRGERGVTADGALDLANALGTLAKLWMNLQATYDLDEHVRKPLRNSAHRASESSLIAPLVLLHGLPGNLQDGLFW